MRRAKALRGMVVAGCASATALASLGVVNGASAFPAAPVSPPTVTLSGRASNGRSPDSDLNNAIVNATLSEGIASGTLRTAEPFGPISGEGREFEGTVTCMHVDGARVTVGAVGTASFRGTPQAGSYIQLLTVEFGEFPNDIEEDGAPFTFTYGDELGIEGMPSKGRPKCRDALFSDQMVDPHFNDGAIFLSPSIKSPKSGDISFDGAVKLSGTGQADSTIEVYEVGHEATGTEVAVSATGTWSLKLAGLRIGARIFQASAVDGSEVPSNIVEIAVV